MSYECFEVTRDGPVAHLKLCRPDELNSMKRSFWYELPQIVRELDREGSARVIVLSSTGRHFSAGMDLGVFAGGLGGLGNGKAADATEIGRLRANLRIGVLEMQETFSILERARMPVIAAIQGGCIGGAVDMVSACDMRYATRDAFFCIQEIIIGMTADVGTLQRLPKIIPEGIVREYAYSGRRLPAERAREVGLLNEIFDDHAALLEGVFRVAHEIAQRSPLAVWGSKEMITYSRDHTVADSLNYIATWQTGMFQPADMGESFKARQEKREPAYPDLLPVGKPI